MARGRPWAAANRKTSAPAHVFVGLRDALLSRGFSAELGSYLPCAWPA
jgi:hypothetical protein